MNIEQKDALKSIVFLARHLVIKCNSDITKELGKNPESSWISTEESKPPVNEIVFIVHHSAGFSRTKTIGFRVDESNPTTYRTSDGGDILSPWITHWAPIPPMKQLVIDYQVFPDFPEMNDA